jgi:hypothetical protein
MASWTDAITQFNPYVSTLPVEAMVKVGMEKQRRYDEGYAKIQAQIDQVAGLDIYKDVDKNYLQSKLNELGGRLQTFAASDFSNYQLVNSVAGMAKQVAADETVQKAVSSTAWYKKQKQLQETLKKEGKSGESNDWLFNQEVNKWINDPKAGATFGASYTPYTNWKKNSLDVIKSLTKDETITDDAFTTKINPKTGKPELVITDAIVRKKMAGISPEKIQQALLTGLTPNDFRQMEIDGRYSYSNVDNESFIKDVNDRYSTNIKFYADQKAILENAKASTNSVVEKKKLDDQISSLDKTINSIQNEYNSVTKTFQNGDVESAKARLFTIDSLNGFSKAFSHTETSLTYENSPLADMQMRREVKEMDWKKFTLDYQQKEKFHQDDLEQKRLDRAEKKEENRLKKLELEGYGGLPGPVDPSLVPTYDLSRLTDEVTKGDADLTKSDNTFLAQKGKDKNWLDQQMIAWEKSPNGVDPDVAHYFKSTTDLRRKIEADKQIILEANNAAKTKYGTIDDLIPKDAKSIDYFSKEGNYRYNPKDFIEFNDIVGRYQTSTSTGSGGSPSFGGTTGGTIVKWDDEKAKKDLSPKMYNLYKIYKNSKTGKELGSGGKSLISTVDFYKKNVNVPYYNLLKPIMDETNRVINERLTTSQGVAYGIPTASAAQKTSIANVLNRFADLADKTGGGLPDSPNFKSATARALALEDGANYSFTVVEGTERQPKAYMMSVSGKAGSVSMRVTPEQKAAVFGSSYEASPAVQAIRPYQEQIRKTGGYSTAPVPNAPTTPSNSFMNSIDFPGVNTYGVKGNLIKISDELYTIKLAIYDPITQSWNNDISFPRQGLLTEEAVAPAMGMLSDAAIYELLNEKVPTARDIKMLQSASKKPL